MDAPPILILDDGELDDVVEILDRLGEPFVRLRGGAIPERVEAPRRLLVATARRASLACDEHATPGAPRAVRIAVVEEDSNTLRSRLRRLGFDWLVRRPVHPHALRLVLLRALFDGRERRTQDRLPVGTPVHVRAGLRRRDAVMLDLSARGCRLLLRDPLAPGARVTVHLPREATGGRGMTLRARVVRTHPGEAGGVAAGVVFERVSRDVQERLHALLQERARGPAALPRPSRPRWTLGLGGRRREEPATAAAEPPAPPPEAVRLEPSSASDRRKHPRVAYRELVRGVAEEAHLALVGRDLSAGGMRIAPHPALREGDRLVLHLYGEATEEPVPVRGRVTRDQGEEGLGIRFERLSPEAARRIERLVAALPAVESLAEGESDALGSIVSRIVEREGGDGIESDPSQEGAEAAAGAGGDTAEAGAADGDPAPDADPDARA